MRCTTFAFMIATSTLLVIGGACSSSTASPVRVHLVVFGSVTGAEEAGIGQMSVVVEAHASCDGVAIARDSVVTNVSGSYRANLDAAGENIVACIVSHAITTRGSPAERSPITMRQSTDSIRIDLPLGG